MKFYSLLLWIYCLATSMVWAQKNTPDKFYLGTYTNNGAEGIYYCTFDPESGDIQHVNTTTGIQDPTFLKVSPCKNYLYVVSRSKQVEINTGGYVIAYRIGDNGKLELINKKVSNGADPCFVDVSADGKYVAIATYGSGTVSLYPINNNGSLGDPISTIQNEGSGPSPRQTKPHAHSIRFSPFDQSVFSADLGTDQLDIYKLTSTGLKKGMQEFVGLPPGSGPRHFEFHPSGKVIYVINELSSTVSILQNEGKTWELVKNISTLPEDFKGDSFCADIHLSPDGKYLYGSNRGHNSIAVFKVSKGGRDLALLGTVSVHGNWPRNFAIHSSGKYLLAANQKSGNVVVFRLSKEDGFPVYTGKEIQLPSPVCIEFF